MLLCHYLYPLSDPQRRGIEVTFSFNTESLNRPLPPPLDPSPLMNRDFPLLLFFGRFARPFPNSPTGFSFAPATSRLAPLLYPGDFRFIAHPSTPSLPPPPLHPLPKWKHQGLSWGAPPPLFQTPPYPFFKRVTHRLTPLSFFFFFWYLAVFSVAGFDPPPCTAFMSFHCTPSSGCFAYPGLSAFVCFAKDCLSFRIAPPQGLTSHPLLSF